MIKTRLVRQHLEHMKTLSITTNNKLSSNSLVDIYAFYIDVNDVNLNSTYNENRPIYLKVVESMRALVKYNSSTTVERILEENSHRMANFYTTDINVKQAFRLILFAVSGRSPLQSKPLISVKLSTSQNANSDSDSRLAIAQTMLHHTGWISDEDSPLKFDIIKH